MDDFQALNITFLADALLSLHSKYALLHRANDKMWDGDRFYS